MSFRDIPKSEIGRQYDDFTHAPVTAAALIRYAKTLAVEDPNYIDEEAAASGRHGGLIAFPTYIVKLRGEHHLPPVVVEEMDRNTFDGGKDIELGAPLRPGDVITTTSRITELFEKTGRSGSMFFVKFRNELVNQRGEMVGLVDCRSLQKLPLPEGQA
ncbi:MAG: MaoC family dehydratase N-terminal domain-containing protein [Deltaproteobacteria bacterium]